MAGRFSVETVFKAIDRISAPISRMANRVGKFTRSMKRKFQSLTRKVDKFGAGIKKAGLIAVASLAIAGAAGADVVRTFADFEQSVVNAAAKFPGAIKRGTDAFRRLEDAARSVGKTTEFTASQAAQGLNFLAMAGFSAAQSVAALPGLVNLATAAQIDLAAASDIATDTLGAFALTSKDAAQNALNLARVSDVLAATTTSANTNMEDLFETIKGAGAVVTSAGGSIETFAALAGKLANAGLKASTAGTTLKNIFLRLSAPASNAAKLLKGLGVATKDSEGNLRDMIDIFADLDKGLAGLGTAERAEVLNKIFGLRAITGANILLKEGATSLRAYRRQLEGADGAASDMAATMRDTLLGRFKSLGSAIESVKISLTKLKSDGIEEMINGITEWIRKIDEGINANQELAGGALVDLFNIIVNSLKLLGIFIAAFVILKFIVLAVQVAIIAFNIAMGIFNGLMFIATLSIGKTTVAMLLWKGLALALTVGMAAFNGVMTIFNIVMAANPIGAIILGITALIAIVVLLVKNWGAVSDFFSGLWDSIISSFSGAIDFIKKGIDLILNPLSALRKAFSGLGEKFGIIIGAEVKAEEQRAVSKPAMVSPSERVARQIEEKREKSTVDVTINDNTGRADVSAKGPIRNGGLTVARSGAF